MPPIRALLVLIAAIVISFFAAYMSIAGMYALFPAAGWVIIGSMIGVEFAKLVAAEAVHAEWSTGLLNRAKRAYLSLAIGALMAITAMGVYGFLAKGHLEQAAPLAPVQLQIGQREARMGQLREELGRLTTQQNQSNAAVDNMLKNSQSSRDARAGLRARNQAGSERKELQGRIDEINAEVNTLNQELVPLKMQVADVSAKLGPLQYVADLFGWKDPEAAVRLIIMLLMFAFDPLAIVLMIVGTNIWGRWNQERRAAPVDNSVDDVLLLDEPVVSDPEPAPEPIIPDVEDRSDYDRADMGDEVAQYDEPVHNNDGWAIEPDHRPISMTEVLRELELRPHEPEAPPAPVLGEDLSDEELSALLAGDAPVFVPTPNPGTWGYVADHNPLLVRNEPPEIIEPEEEAPASLLPELEKMLSNKVEKTDAESIVELLKENPELLDEVADILNDDPELLEEVAKEAEKPQSINGWLDTSPKK